MSMMEPTLPTPPSWFPYLQWGPRKIFSPIDMEGMELIHMLIFNIKKEKWKMEIQISYVNKKGKKKPGEYVEVE